MSNRDRDHNPGKGENFGQGLAGISDKDRRDLARASVTEDDHGQQRADDSRPEGDVRNGQSSKGQSSSADQRK